MQIAAATAPPATTTTSPTGPVAAAQSDRNPWGFPRLDRAVAQQAYDGIRAGVEIVNRLIDRSIAVRVQLDRDLEAGTFAPDTIRAVELLTRARDYALGTLGSRHLPRQLEQSVHAWIRSNPKDTRIGVVADAIRGLDRAVNDLLDDDEGNVRESIASMRSAPGRGSWNAVRESLDMGIATLYGSRDVSSSLHVLRAAGELG